MSVSSDVRERESEQREKWMLGKRLAGAGSRRASSGSAGNMVTLSPNWISCLEAGIEDSASVPLSPPEESYRYHSNGVQHSWRVPQYMLHTRMPLH